MERQNAWPSVDRDVHGWLNTFSFMMPPGFYYKIFQRPSLGVAPRRAVHPVEGRTRDGARTSPITGGGGRINLHPDVLVIGAGAAGLAAAAAAGKAGAHGRAPRAGPRGRRPPAGGRRAARSDRASRGSARVGNVRFLPETAAFGVFGGRLVAAAGADALYRIRARHVIFATGAVEQSAVFPGNDLPGVMVSSGVHLLLHRYGVLPGRRAVVLAGDNVGYPTAWALRDAGAEVTVVDLRSEGGWPEGFPVFAGSTIVSAHGRRRRDAASRWGHRARPPGRRSPATSS